MTKMGEKKRATGLFRRYMLWSKRKCMWMWDEEFVVAAIFFFFPFFLSPSIASAKYKCLCFKERKVVLVGLFQMASSVEIAQQQLFSCIENVRQRFCFRHYSVVVKDFAYYDSFVSIF